MSLGAGAGDAGSGKLWKVWRSRSSMDAVLSDSVDGVEMAVRRSS